MTNTEKKGLPLFTKITIVINTLLFGITGVVYLTRGENLIGYVLLAAGFSNIIFTITSPKMNKRIFAVLNFVFAIVAFVVAVDYWSKESKYFTLIWFVITLAYLIMGFFQWNTMKKKQDASPAE